MIRPKTTEHKTRWLTIQEAHFTGKTYIWHVFATEGGERLGQIKWFGRWRKYCFFALDHTVFEQDCLRDLADFIEARTKEHRKRKREAKTND